MSLGVTTWISGMFSQKSLVFLSVTSTITTYLPARLAPHLEDIMFVIGGWIVAVLLALIELKTSTARTKTAKQKAKMLTLVKIVVYTMIFFALKFFHLWILFDDHTLVGAGINIVVISIYALVALGEFKLIGNNIDKRYGSKPKVFAYLDGMEKWIARNIVKKAEKVCDVDPEKETESLED